MTQVEFDNLTPEEKRHAFYLALGLKVGEL